MPTTVRDVIEKAKAGGRLADAEALLLFEKASLPELGEGAHAIRRRLHPENVATYIVDRNVNYTNTCITYCKFCAFYRPPGHPEEYTLTREAMARKIQETKALGGVQILLQGGHHPYDSAAPPLKSSGSVDYSIVGAGRNPTFSELRCHCRSTV